MKSLSFVLLFLVAQQMVPFSSAFTPLQAMISVEATASTILKNLNHEVVSEGVFLNAIVKSHYIGSDIITTGLLGAAFFSKIKNINEKNNETWETIPLYIKTKKNINKIVLILMIIFTKNIENAI
jgi:hypothetical protein